MVKNLKDLMLKFSDETVCREVLIKQRWPDGNIQCQYCGHNKCYRIENGNRFKCANKECYKRFRVTVGTIFEASNIPLTTWFPAMYLILSHKKGISSIQLGKDLGVTQKTAWFMLHRIREQLKANNSSMLSGVCEVDETFIGGKMKNKHKKVRAAAHANNDSHTLNKVGVMGLLERGNSVRLQVIDSSKQTLKQMVKQHIEPSAIVITDSLNAYSGLAKTYSQHEVVNHIQDEYVRGMYHTNSIEGFFSLLKRGIYGIYHQVSPKHLSRYCDEFAHRYNSRHLKDGDRFTLSLCNLEGRLTYKQLVHGNQENKEGGNENN